MVGTIQNYTLDMADGTAPKPLIVKQGDTNSRQARISLKAFDQPWTIPFGCQIQINVRKNDGTYANATCNQEDEHTVLAPITEQMAAVSGTHLGELFFLGSDGDIRSQTFPLVVWDAVSDLDLMASSDDFRALKDALRNVKTSTEAADRAAQYATEQGNSARDMAQRAENAAESLQQSIDSAAAAKVSETNAKTSETAAAQTQQEVTDYVESQKAAFVGYSKRESDSKYANAIIKTATGEGGVIVEDAWTAPVLELDVAGKSEQVVTTGAQMLDANMFPSRTMDGVAFTNNGDGSFTVSGSGALSDSLSAIYTIPHDVCTGLFSAGAYKFMLLNGIRTVPYVYVKFGNIMEMNTDGKVVNLTDEMIADPNFSVRIGYYAQAGSTIYTGTTKPMLYKVTDDQPLPWEPYTGGAPSPSPDYPQDIISTGTVSTGTQLLNADTIVQGMVNADTGELSSSSIAVSSDYIEVRPGSYFLSGEGLKPYMNRVVFYTAEKAYISSDSVYTNNGLIAVPETAAYMRLRFVGTENLTPADIKALKPMLNTGSTALPWEPYTGGKPSPSVEYPQTLEVTAAGAQLLDESYVTKSINGLTLTANDNGSFSIAGTATATTSIGLIGDSSIIQKSFRKGGKYCFSLINASYNYNTCNISIGYANGGSETKFFIAGETKELPAGTEFRGCTLWIGSGITVNLSQVKCMFNTGDTALPWEPYRSATAPITLTEPLRGIGDYRDRIMCKDGVWGIERWIKEIVLDGSADEAWYNSSGGNDPDHTYAISPLACKAVSNKIKCNKILVREETLWDYYGEGIATSANLERMTMKVLKSRIGSDGIEAFKTWLSGNPVTAVYPLATPTWTPLPDATQQALNALTTYAGTTHLTITAGGTTPSVTLDYVQDTHKAFEQCQEAAKEYTDSQIAAIVAALPTATQAAIADNQTTRLLQEV